MGWRYVGGWTAAIEEAGDNYTTPLPSGPVEYSLQESETIAVVNTFIWEGG